MSIKTIYVQPGGGFDQVVLGKSDASAPKTGEITVRIRASSLNYHDYAVVSGAWGPTTPRIPMSDGAGEVTAVGEGVTEFAVGDHVVSTFFPTWLDGEPIVDGFSTVPGDGVDGFAPRTGHPAHHCIHPCPEGLQPCRSGNADHRRPHRLACLDEQWQPESR
jgi:NADPH:quinone reductase-like Zn-dependent oxidoreductase